jgi:hypothetical protein
VGDADDRRKRSLDDQPQGNVPGMYRADGSPGWLYKSRAEHIRAVEMNFRAFVGAS